MPIPTTPREIIQSNVEFAAKLMRISLAIEEQNPGALSGMEQAQLQEASDEVQRCGDWISGAIK